MIERYKPAAGKGTLLFLGGFVWACVGAMLLTMAHGWLAGYQGGSPLPFALMGAMLALVIHHFGFLKIVDRNLGRLLPGEERRCLFAFMPWKSYLMVVLMMGMGYLLRHSPISKKYLAVVYIGIGLALVLSSVRYFRMLLNRR